MPYVCPHELLRRSRHPNILTQTYSPKHTHPNILTQIYASQLTTSSQQSQAAGGMPSIWHAIGEQRLRSIMSSNIARSIRAAPCTECVLVRAHCAKKGGGDRDHFVVVVAVIILARFQSMMLYRFPLISIDFHLISIDVNRFGVDFHEFHSICIEFH